jgi:hypothetical protein
MNGEILSTHKTIAAITHTIRAARGFFVPIVAEMRGFESILFGAKTQNEENAAIPGKKAIVIMFPVICVPREPMIRPMMPNTTPIPLAIAKKESQSVLGLCNNPDETSFLMFWFSIV